MSLRDLPYCCCKPEDLPDMTITSSGGGRGGDRRGSQRGMGDKSWSRGSVMPTPEKQQMQRGGRGGGGGSDWQRLVFRYTISQLLVIGFNACSISCLFRVSNIHTLVQTNHSHSKGSSSSSSQWSWWSRRTRWRQKTISTWWLPGWRSCQLCSFG